MIKWSGSEAQGEGGVYLLAIILLSSENWGGKKAYINYTVFKVKQHFLYEAWFQILVIPESG